ncbi:hypothetical protein HL658_35195 [Azospirillum sp. RWY-5-1]|uniref:GP-PDE domain-containing protein n=1 Tax=Azospirillum oleiclasticum TaxID=2735135 RepID=A0ABX2TL15_9PROT|nr:hypothetical protein [Azospirillum oleiclasticum]NYZ17818.1 hypothetical protein [Azospirillum oleiclasticum]NYZ25050.1 hypothetical protein [Azospirillum oleiclasticum]
MKIYSHRGNLSGKSPRENEPAFILEAIAAGFHVEVDLRFVDGAYFLGHDGPEHPIDLADFDREEIIFHLKTPHVPALRHADCFAIENDPYVLTRLGLLWTNYNRPPTPEAVMCAPELVGDERPLDEFVRAMRHHAAGICTDHPLLVRQVLAGA